MINPNNFDEILKALDRQIQVHDGASVSLVICGGTAPFALGLISRTTKDVDVLGTVSKERGQIIVMKIINFPVF
jgi:hypothetical protein